VAFAHWDPFRDLLAIQQRLDQFASGPAGWVPPVDVHESDDRYVITAELPGLTREDVQIHVQDNRVALAGARREHVGACEQYHRIERGHGTFSRTFELPVAIVVEEITADLKDGVLTVILPKSAEGAPRRIRVG
jgi:HSP20 family protein